MTDAQANLLLTAVISFIFAGAGAYFGSYLKQKGKNLATHEDINLLRDQVSVVTTTTKEIEDKIDSDSWVRQKQWELRQGVLFDAARRLTEADDALLMLNSAKQSSNVEPDQQENWLELKVAKQKRWGKAAAALDETRFFVAVVCEKEAVDAIESYAMLANLVAGGLATNLDSYKNAQVDLVKMLFAARSAIRKELGVDAKPTPQSTVSSASPSLD